MLDELVNLDKVLVKRIGKSAPDKDVKVRGKCTWVQAASAIFCAVHGHARSSVRVCVCVHDSVCRCVYRSSTHAGMSMHAQTCAGADIHTQAWYWQLSKTPCHLLAGIHACTRPAGAALHPPKLLILPGRRPLPPPLSHATHVLALAAQPELTR